MDITTYGALLSKVKDNKPTDAQVEQAVNDWLDDHPEATTTVQDGSITKAKLDSNLQGTVDDVVELKSQMTNVENAVEELEAGSLSALGATEGQVPVADGEGSWGWQDQQGGGGVLKVTESNNTLDKTWQEINDAGFSILTTSGEQALQMACMEDEGDYLVTYWSFGWAEPSLYIASSPSDYPVHNA